MQNYYPALLPITGPDGFPIDTKGDPDLQQALSIELVLGLDGRVFSTLTPAELELFKFYRDKGRKFGVVATILTAADLAELAEANSQAHQDEIMRRVNSTVSVIRS